MQTRVVDSFFSLIRSPFRDRFFLLISDQNPNLRKNNNVTRAGPGSGSGPGPEMAAAQRAAAADGPGPDPGPGPGSEHYYFF